MSASLGSRVPCRVPPLTRLSGDQEPDCFNQYAVLSEAGASTAIYSNSLPEPTLIEERKVRRPDGLPGCTLQRRIEHRRRRTYWPLARRSDVLFSPTVIERFQ